MANKTKQNKTKYIFVDLNKQTFLINMIVVDFMFE